MADSLSRRGFMGRMGASALALASASLPARALGATPGPPPGTGLSLDANVHTSLLPTPRQIHDQVAQMVSFGPRLTGSPAHQRWIDTLEQELSDAGVTMSRDHFTFPRWLADHWSLEVLEGPGRGRQRVASYFPYSGSTPPGGVEGELAYVGPVPLPSVSGNPVDLYTDQAAFARFAGELADDVRASLAGVPGGVKDRILLVDAPVPPLSAGDFEPLVTYTHDPDLTIQAYSDYKRVWVCGTFVQYVLQAIKQSGAAGVVFALDASPGNASGQYTPYAQPVFGIPALYVDRDTGRSLRRLAQANPRTRLTLTAELTPSAPSDSLVGIMPGDCSTDEVIILNTHTDGQNAFEENGGVALLAAARYFKALGRKARKRTLVFSAFTGHFGPTLPQTQGLVDYHPDLIKRAVASITVEHFGAPEWLDDAHGYHPTGYNEMAAIWHSQTPIAAPLVESMRAVDLRRSSALRPAGDYMIAVGGPLHKAGVPSISYIAGPNYLVDLTPGDHLGKVDTDRFHRELVWTMDMIQRLDDIPAAVLAAGDTAAYRQDGGALKSLP